MIDRISSYLLHIQYGNYQQQMQMSTGQDKFSWYGIKSVKIGLQLPTYYHLLFAYLMMGSENFVSDEVKHINVDITSTDIISILCYNITRASFP